MKLTVFNGSPRGPKSNTAILLRHFLAGFEETPGNTHELFYLNRTREAETFYQAFCSAENVLLAFPLYTDSMPGLVKAFIESLEPCLQREVNPPMIFLVQSGFPEAHHSRFVERYLRKLAKRLHSACGGVMVRGGVEGLQIQPEKSTAGLRQMFHDLGKDYGAQGQLDEALLLRLAQPEKLSLSTRLISRLLSPTGLLNFYWNMLLKQNQAYDRRFAKPYE